MKLIILFLTISLFIFSCSQNNYLDNSIDKSYISFSNTDISDTISYLEKDIYTLQIPIQCYGVPLQENTDIIINYISGNLKENYHFNKIETDTIPSKIINDTLYMYIKTDKLYANYDYNCIISLISNNENVIIPENSNSCNISFQKQSYTSFYTGTYSCYEDATNATYNVVFKRENDSTIQNQNFWDFPGKNQTLSYKISRENNTIVIPESEWIDALENTYTISGEGELFENGNFNVEYTMKDIKGEIYQTGTHFFTK